MLFPRNRVLASLVIGGTALAATVATASLASAKPPPEGLVTTYQVNGSSFIAAPSTTVTLGPATLKTHLKSQNNKLSGNLPLPDTTTAFSEGGLIPVTATVSFIQSGQVYGKINPVENATTISATARYYLQLSNVTVGGLPVDVGTTCETQAPAVIKTATPAGQTFSILDGGTVTGTYTIPQFANCGASTTLINTLVPGAGNTVSLTLSDFMVVNQ